MVTATHVKSREVAAQKYTHKASRYFRTARADSSFFRAATICEVDKQGMHV